MGHLQVGAGGSTFPPPWHGCGLLQVCSAHGGCACSRRAVFGGHAPLGSVHPERNGRARARRLAFGKATACLTEAWF